MEYQKKRKEFTTALKEMEEAQSAMKEWLDDITPYYETQTEDAGEKILEVYFAAVQIHYKNLKENLTAYKENLREFDKSIKNPQQALTYVNTLEYILKDVNEILAEGSNALRNFRYYDQDKKALFD